MKQLRKKIYLAALALATAALAATHDAPVSSKSAPSRSLAEEFVSPASNAADIYAKLQLEIANRAASKKGSSPSYYFVPFAYQGPGNLASDSHTFASVVAVDRDGEQHWTTISWLPEDFAETRTICIFGGFWQATWWEFAGNDCPPVPGRNAPLRKTLTWGSEPGMEIGVWGPYQVSKDFYSLVIRRYLYLNSGVLQYLADDRKTRKKGIAVNCMHAVSDLPGYYDNRGLLQGRPDFGTWGIKGTQHVLKHFLSKGRKDWFKDRVEINKFRRF